MVNPMSDNALGDLGFLVQVWNEASDMASMKTLMALVRVSVSLIAFPSAYLGSLLEYHLGYMIPTKASSHASLLSSHDARQEKIVAAPAVPQREARTASVIQWAGITVDHRLFLT